MCGIAIIIDKMEGNQDTNKENMVKMVAALKHRGPDNQGIYQHNNVTLGHTRLSIIDLSEAGNQPMHYQNLSIVFNGEIYNYKLLKKQLELVGHTFKTNSDTEVLLIGYTEWGTKLFEKLSGMFAFCIYDKSNNEVVVVRDSFGIKPLYYYQDKNRIILASEIKAIRSVVPKSELSINKESINDILQYLYVQGTKTIFTEISRIKTGSFYKINCNNLELVNVKYWQLKKTKPYIDNHNEAEHQVESLLTESIKENMTSDVPVGIFLSGGIDSSLICAIASKYNEQPLHSFSLGFTESGKYLDESKYAEKVSSSFKTIHHTKRIDVVDTMNDIESIIKNMDAPNADASVFLNYIISEYASNYVKVCMSGLGGDELFGGYNRYQAMLLNPIVSKTPYFISNFLLNNKFLKSSRVNKYGNINRAIKKLFDSNEKEPELTYLNLISYLKSPHSKIQMSYEDLNDIMIWDIENYMVNDLLSLTDQMSMASSLEVRVPFLNTDLANLAFQINPKHKTSFTSKKIVLKSVASKYLDEEIINKRKQGFSAPIEIWLRKFSKYYFMSTFISGPISIYVNSETIHSVVHGFYIEKKDYSNQLYALHVLNTWLEGV